MGPTILASGGTVTLSLLCLLTASLNSDKGLGPVCAIGVVVVVFAMLSAISYFRKFWRKVDERIKLGRRREMLTLERKRQRMEMRQRRSRGSSNLGSETIWKPPEVN